MGSTPPGAPPKPGQPPAEPLEPCLDEVPASEVPAQDDQPQPDDL